jgi:hypothetical protein
VQGMLDTPAKGRIVVQHTAGIVGCCTGSHSFCPLLLQGTIQKVQHVKHFAFVVLKLDCKMYCSLYEGGFEANHLVCNNAVRSLAWFLCRPFPGCLAGYSDQARRPLSLIPGY